VAEDRSEKVARLKMISPQFVVPDVKIAAEYYRDVLGFKILDYFMEPPVYAIVRRDAVEIHFGKSDHGQGPARNQERRAGGLDAYIWVTDVDELHAELASRGAKIVEGPIKTVYKCYEIVVEDQFGFRLTFGMDISEKG
jgi:catechol 2,3-dioxygenase-like lactoylglutathione lyase family enzyme